MSLINTWIVEDDLGFRRTVQRLLNDDERISCDDVFPSCIDLFEALKKIPPPDFILMDLGLPDMGGVEGITRLAEIAPDITVVVLTVTAEKNKIVQALNAGASGYLLKNTTGPEIIKGLFQVFYGNTALSPAVAKVVLDEMRKPQMPIERFDLSKREHEVLDLLANGLSVKEIADKLFISRATAAFHLKKVYKKLSVNTQSGAVAKALRSGIIHHS